MAANQIYSWSEEQKINLSGWIRENQGYELLASNLQPLSELKNLTVGEKADKLLDFLAQKYKTPGEKIELVMPALELQAISRAADESELDFLLREYMHEEKGYLLRTAPLGGLTGIELNCFYRISPAGWAYLDSKRQANPKSQIGFIAMWFGKEVDQAHLAIEKGISGSGYEPLRIDRKEHNNKIDDEIVAGIRRSKFLVADFTGHRGGVYFEAGLAMGLGLPVIWLCRNDDLKNTHFDTRQYNFIVWEADKLDELSNALKNRIVATIGQGPLQTASAR